MLESRFVLSDEKGGLLLTGVRALTLIAVFGAVLGVHAQAPGVTSRQQSTSSLHIPAKPSTRQSIDFLTGLAARQIASDPTFLGRVRLTLHAKDRNITYDLNPFPPGNVLSEKDPFNTPFEALIRVGALRRDFRASLPNETFWVAPLDSIRKTARQCIAEVVIGTNQNGCSQKIEARFATLLKSILTYAAEHHLKAVEASQPVTKGPATGYEVQVKIDPPRARIRFMTLLEYKKCLYFKTPVEGQWIDLLGDRQELIGRYHYRAEWPSELNGPEEGDFEITEPETMTFRPKKK